MKKIDYVAAIIVTYKKPQEAANLAINLLKQSSVNLRITIVENSVDKVFAEQLINLLNNSNKIQVHISRFNYGYAKGNNLGLKKTLEKWGAPRYVLISNDDIIIENTGVVKALVSVIKNNKNCGCVQPKITLLNGFIQGPYRKSNIWIESIQYLFPPYWYFLRRLRQQELANINKISMCFRVMGAFFLIKYNQTSLDGKLFDEHTFLFREEEILAIKLLKSGLYSYYNPNIIVHHLQKPKPLEIDLISDKSDLYFYHNILKKSKFLIFFL